MTTIKASCPTCGDVELTADDVELRVCNHQPLSSYRFDCPKCNEVVVKTADEQVIALLMSGGVKAIMWELPAEALEPKAGPPLTYDDLLDFVMELGVDDLLAARAALTAPH
ncbi:MAG TPA: hypothetical protein VG708_12530 [Mycobacteriales bacterium]|jgi:hypothetical protein|nr:hypothetical protein [Mycobacteriales bacterium]